MKARRHDPAFREWERRYRQTSKRRDYERRWKATNKDKVAAQQRRWRKSPAGVKYMTKWRRENRARQQTLQRHWRHSSSKWKEQNRRNSMIQWAKRKFGGMVPPDIKRLVIEAASLREQLRTAGLLTRNGR